MRVVRATPALHRPPLSTNILLLSLLLLLLLLYRAYHLTPFDDVSLSPSFCQDVSLIAFPACRHSFRGTDSLLRLYRSLYSSRPFHAREPSALAAFHDAPLDLALSQWHYIQTLPGCGYCARHSFQFLRPQPGAVPTIPTGAFTAVHESINCHC